MHSPSLRLLEGPAAAGVSVFGQARCQTRSVSCRPHACRSGSAAVNHPHALSEGEEVSGPPGAGQNDGSPHKHPLPLPTTDKQPRWLQRLWGEVGWWVTAEAGKGKRGNIRPALPSGLGNKGVQRSTFLVSQHLPNFNGLVRYLEALLRCRSWFSRTEVQPEGLHV